MRIRFLPNALALLVASTASSGQALPGRVLRVIDGDSLVLEVRGAQYQLDLAGIDAPESNQPWGDAAARRLHTGLAGSFVVVDTQHGRPGEAWTGSISHRGRDVALDLLLDGLAWSTTPDPDHATADGERHPYTVAEQEARAAHRGLWSDEEPIPPWEWRDGGTIPR